MLILWRSKLFIKKCGFTGHSYGIWRLHDIFTLRPSCLTFLWTTFVIVYIILISYKQFANIEKKYYKHVKLVLPMRYGKNRAAVELFSDCILNSFICSSIYCSRSFIQDQDLWPIIVVIICLNLHSISFIRYHLNLCFM